MIAKNNQKHAQVHPDYLALIRRFPLRPIRNESQHDMAMRIVTELAVREQRSSGDQDYLDALTVLLEDFDRQEAAPPANLDGVDLLRHLMEANDLNVSDIGRIIGSQPNASLILAGRRQMSKAAIQKLASRFGVNPGLFLRQAIKPA